MECIWAEGLSVPPIVSNGFKAETVGRPKMPNFTRMRRGSCLSGCVVEGCPIEAGNDQMIVGATLTRRMRRRSGRQSAQHLVGRADAQVWNDAKLVRPPNGEPPHALVMLSHRHDVDRDARMVAMPSGEERREPEIRGDRFQQRMPTVDPADGACHTVEDDARTTLFNIQHEVE